MYRTVEYPFLVLSAVAGQYVLLRGLIMHCLRHAWIYVLLFDAPPCVGGIVRVPPATSWNDASFSPTRIATCKSGSIVHIDYCMACYRPAYVLLTAARTCGGPAGTAACTKKKHSC